MSDPRSRLKREFPTPNQACRIPPSRLRRQKKRSRLPLLILAGWILFAAGFQLGRVREEGGVLPADTLGFAFLPEEPEPKGAVTVRTVPGVMPEAAGEKETEDWRLILVNAENPLPEDFAVPELTKLRGGHAVDSRAYPDLQRMMDDCRAEGLEPAICSSYRSGEKQAELFESKVLSCLGRAGSRQEAEALAAEWISRPGTSEHQAGLALDIVDKSYQLLDKGQENTAVQKWLMAHCAEYGFILRYPTDKSALTGVGYEPWHYRYVGAEAAREIMSRGICLEEYLSVVNP